jgi:ankyrin repeat protein
MSKFLAKGWNPNIKYKKTYILHEAIKNNNSGMVNLLLENKSNPYLVVDEVDSLFIDMAMNLARLAISSHFHTSWIYEIIFYYVKRCRE